MAAVDIPAMAEEGRERTLPPDPDTPDRHSLGSGSDPDPHIAAAGPAVDTVVGSEQGSLPEGGPESSGELGRSKPGHLQEPRSR
jgi:hypothetical protein